MIYINDNIYSLDLAASLDTISVQRRKQALQFVQDSDRRLCIAAYILLKQGLQQEYGITENPIFGYNENGKPFIIGYPEIYFNISHCKKAAICAIDSHPIGIDIETICEYEEDLKRYVLNDKECQQVQNARYPDVEFIRLWTMKESYLKLKGEGIHNDLKELLPNKAKYTTVINLQQQYIYTVCQ